ncbi:uncharacterized protein LOC8267226 isoform X1 [Ricinus communis]|uniref:uncharacterized protein LOC8267226 isoform X1 n=2 Tax=Ricinus communis TaxID=3988 RepID=UPI000772449E|nr:uncharacterized protein LOC8267226 isoform X1 [Ricinus communis]|eukprot:XP_015576752.1 uncharacterized protein LOC8267226 [Ricinus communis]
MEFHALTTITAPPQRIQQQQQHSMCYFRGLFHQVKAFLFILVLSCTLFFPATCGPCLDGGMQKSAEHDGCGSYGDDSAVDSQDVIVADAGSGYHDGSSMTRLSIKSICANSHSFCFPSTLSGLSSKEHRLKVDSSKASRTESESLSSVELTQGSKGASNSSWLSDSGLFELLSGQTVFCSLNSMDGVSELSSMQSSSANQNDLSSCRGPLTIKKSTGLRLNMNSELTKSSSFDVFSSSHVEISPPVLDWGHKNLYFPSVAFLTVANMFNDSILYVYEPFSTNIQFYACNFSEFFLRPGEVASVCFVFLPRWLGLSSAHLILQTSSGGFLVQAKGYAVESPYKISTVMNQDSSCSGRLITNLSLFNPLNEDLYVKEISAWISISQGNASHHTEAICSLANFQESNGLSLLNVEDWLIVKSDLVGSPLMAMRPHENWDIGPYGCEAVIDIDFSFESEAHILGALCVQLLRSSQDKPDTILVPLEIDLDGKVAGNGITDLVSVSLEALLPSHSSKTLIAISLRNGASHVLRVVKISEVPATKVFMMKYIHGLLLFPGTVTQVATITCTQLIDELHDSPPEISNVNKNCKLVILTNDSISPQIEIPCRNLIRICLRHQRDSSIGLDCQSENAESDNRRTGSLDSSTQLPSEIMALETMEGDEFVLENWKSQGTTNSMSVLDDHEVLFPMVQVGTQHSKWITVKNPSEQPVIMQLILNSGEIIDECRGRDGLVQPLSLGNLVHNEFTASKYGFSMSEGAQTEAYVHPFGKASFGPIFFHPSNRCGWTSSALIRNNLSGVEWLPLRGFGGSLSLVLLEGSEPVQSIEFNLNLPFPLNMSAPDLLTHTEDTTYACSQPLSKELYAKNMGDLPLEVKRIEVSGTECGLDGFVVHTCKGFSLEPGESMKLLISYQSDFYAAMLQRDLELALASGILVIPMKASLPSYMFNLCKKSVFWMRLKKFSAMVLLSASLIFLIFCCIFPEVINFGSQDYSCKNEKNSITAMRSSGKSARLHHNQRNSKFSVSTELDGLLRSTAEGKTSKDESGFKYPDRQLGGPDQGIIVQNGIPVPEHHKQVPSLLSKSVVAENSSIALEASQPCNLTVKIGKEKGRRRRKRKGVTAGLTGLFEVSSSQSGNSTPSSPLSPQTSLTPNRTLSTFHDTDPIEARTLSTQVADQQCKRAQVAEPTAKETVPESKYSLKRCSSSNCFSSNPEPSSLPRETTTKPVLLPSATFCSAGRAVSNVLSLAPSPASTATIAPHARAPGPKPYNQKKVEERVGDEYTYDIWGDHFSGLHLVVGSSEATTMKTIATENNSSSFFVRGPQALVAESQPKSRIEAKYGRVGAKGVSV